ncbi:MAG TPA: glutamate-1-semialdehyde 2,1-aminomutase [Candidatus Nitrosocosmicus sp.]|nr:glutamate-1-semialdehyde 2,1-aminomutase [Candidatus Nitrosocosmicus sp.]
MTDSTFDKSRNLFERAVKLFPGGVNSPVRYFQPHPFFVESANGSKLFTNDGNVLIDYCLGYGSVFLGHGNQEIGSEVKHQIEKGNLFCTPTEKEIELAEVCIEIIPCAERVRIMNTGAEATMHSIRLARAFTKKTKIIKFEGGYHGAYDYVLNKAGSGAAVQQYADGILNEGSAKTITMPFNNFEALESTIKKDENQNDIACIIVEPVLANTGLILPEKEYLNDLRNITKENNIVLIFDEVITGFRLALGGAGEFFGIKPDLATFAKTLGNGFPISLIAGNKEIMSGFAPSGSVYQASTFAGNPISVTAALKTLDILTNKKNTIYPNVARTCDKMVKAIRDIVEGKKLNVTVNSIGSMYQLFFTENPVRDYASVKTSDGKSFDRLFRTLLSKGIFIPPSPFETCFISTVHNEEDLEKTIDAYEFALSKVKNI